MNTVLDIQRKFGVNHIYAQGVLYRSRNEKQNVETIIDEDPKPFVKWVGGKRQLLKQFRDIGLYPPELFDTKKGSYFEPFAGGGAVFFDLLPQKAYLSDLNLELVTTYNVTKNNVEK